MTKSYSIDYGGKTYTLDGPDDATEDQVREAVKRRIGEREPGNTRGGDLARGLLHGVEAGIGLAGDAPQFSTGWRKTGEEIGKAAPGFAAGFIPGGMAVKTGIGAVTGALQPAQSWKERAENAAIGGGSALTGQGLNWLMSPAVKSSLNTLANEAIGSAMGSAHLGPWGTPTGVWLGRGIGHQVQNLFGGRGLAHLIAAAARNPGLAAYLGIKASPYAEQAGQFVGEELGKPSE